MPCTRWVARITSTSQENASFCFVSSAFTLYHITVRCNQTTPPRHWETTRRYREFVALDTVLRSKQTRMPYRLPHLPEKRMCFNLDDSFIKERMQALNQYLEDLLADGVIAALDEVQAFLMPLAGPAHVMSSGAISARSTASTCFTEVDDSDLVLDRPRVKDIEDRVTQRGSIIAALQLVQNYEDGGGSSGGGGGGEVVMRAEDLAHLKTLLVHGEEEYELQCHKLKVATRELSITAKMIEGIHVKTSPQQGPALRL